MTTATLPVDPASAQMLWATIGSIVTGPVAGVWTITAPDSVSQETLDGFAAQAHAEIIAHNNALALMDKGRAALVINADFLALGAPTNAQVLAQTKALTRQVNALIRLQTFTIADTSGT